MTLKDFEYIIDPNQEVLIWLYSNITYEVLKVFYSGKWIDYNKCNDYTVFNIFCVNDNCFCISIYDK